jgi:hypothetical protein
MTEQNTRHKNINICRDCVNLGNMNRKFKRNEIMEPYPKGILTENEHGQGGNYKGKSISKLQMDIELKQIRVLI